jgi:WD40 repeat protein
MAFVVCQVVKRSNRWMLTWSAGKTTFATYGIDGPAAVAMQRLIQQADEQMSALGSAADASGNAAHQLAKVGHALYRLVFSLDQPGPLAAHEVQGWLEKLAEAGQVEELRITGDVLSLPWPILCSAAPDQAAIGPAPSARAWQPFWVNRFPLCLCRRVSGMEPISSLASKSVVLAIDPEARAALPADEQSRIQDFAARAGAVVVDSAEKLADIFATQAVPFLYLFGPADGNGVRLGPVSLTASVIEEMALAPAEDDAVRTRPVLFVNAHASGSFQLAAFDRFGHSGLIGPWRPLAPLAAHRAGLAWLQQAIGGGSLKQAAAAWRTDPVACILYGVVVDVGGDALQDEPPPLELPAQPYKPLAPLDEYDAPLLVGRDWDVAEVARLLDEVSVQLVLLHGEAGVGKASLVRAGLVPALEYRAVGYRFLRDRAAEDSAAEELDYPLLTIRATSDLPGQLALALFDFCSRPWAYTTPVGQTVKVDLPAMLEEAVRAEMGDAPPTTARLRDALWQDTTALDRVLTAITAELPFDLVLVVEHADELFSLAPPERATDAALDALAMLRGAMDGAARVKFVLTARTAYAALLLEALPRVGEQAALVRSFVVRELTQDDLLEVALQATANAPLPGSDQVPQQVYGLAYETGLAETVAKDVLRLAGANQESALVLVHVICARLYGAARSRAEKVVWAGDLKNLGGIEKGVAKYVAHQVKQVGSLSDRRELKKLLTKLFIRQPDGSLTRDLQPESELAKQWRGSTPLPMLVDRAAGPDAVLLNVAYCNIGGVEGRFVSLGHDSLAPIAAQQAEENSRRKAGWSGMWDALWITIPLMVLLGVFLWTRLNAASSSKSVLEEEIGETRKQNALMLDLIGGTFWSSYAAKIGEADRALRSGNYQAAREALLAAKRTSDNDLRGFEWHYLWSALQKEIVTLVGHRGTVTGVALTADGLTMATASDDGVVRLWDPASGRVLAQWPVAGKAGTSPARCVAFSPDGLWLAAAGDDGQIRLWPVARTDLYYPANLAGLIGGLALNTGEMVSPIAEFGGRRLVEETLKIPAAALLDHGGAVLALAFAPDGKALAGAGKDGTIKVWDLSATPATLNATLKDLRGSIDCAAYSPDGKWLATGGADRRVVLWDAKTGDKKHVLEGHPQRITALAWRPDSAQLVTASGEEEAEGDGEGFDALDRGVLKLWDTASGKEQKLAVKAGGPIYALAFVSGGKALAMAGFDHSVHVAELDSGREIGVLRGHRGWARSLASARSGEILASGSFDTTARLWRVQPAPPRDQATIGQAPVLAVAFAPDPKSQRLAAAGADGVVKILDAISLAELLTIQAGKEAVRALAWSKDGNSLVTGGADGFLKWWDTDPKSATYGKELDNVQGHTAAVTAVLATELERVFCSAGLDGRVRTWRITKGQVLPFDFAFKTESPIHCMALFESAGKVYLGLLATGHQDGKVRFWDIETGRAPELQIAPAIKGVLEGHTGPVLSMTMYVIPNRKSTPSIFLVTGSADRSLKVWDLFSGTEHLTVRTHEGAVTAVAGGFEPLQMVISGATDQTVKLWGLWDTRSFKGGAVSQAMLPERWSFTPGVAAVYSVSMSSNGRMIAVGGQDGTVKIYRATREP